MKLLLDTAHSVVGGGDPAEAVRKYRERILLDIPVNTPGAKYPFEWVELGRARVDFPAVFAALDRVKFDGWEVVELDRVMDPARTAARCD